jgi:hypothetical protein
MPFARFIEIAESVRDPKKCIVDPTHFQLAGCQPTCQSPQAPIDGQSILWDVIISTTAAVKLTGAEYPPHCVDHAKHHLQSYKVSRQSPEPVAMIQRQSVP